MITKRLSLAIIVSICVGSGMAWSHFQPSVPPLVAGTRIDFNQTFADVAGRNEFNSSSHDRLRDFGWNLIVAEAERGSGGLAPQTVNRAGKGDRLPDLKSVVFERIRLSGCEPVASPFADPILGQIVGRCDA